MPQQYTGDKRMDPFTQLRMFYKRKGIPLSPFGWFVVVCVLIFVVYELYSIAHGAKRKNVLATEPSSFLGDGIAKDVLRSGNRIKEEKASNKNEKIINELGESGLAGGHVLGKLQLGSDIAEEKNAVKDEKKVVEELGVEDGDKKEKDEYIKESLNEEPPGVKPIPHDPRFRVTMDPSEFGGQIVEVKRPDQPDEKAKGDALMPDIEPFVRDDRLVPLAHLEHIPKPKAKAIHVNVRLKPNYAECVKQDMIILVHSQAMNSELRTGIRATWYDSNNYARFKNQTNLWKVIFIVGRTYDSYDEHVKTEARDNNDLIQADLVESQYEDTRKFVLGTNFLVDTFKDCAPKFVLKTQDNVFLNMISIEGWLSAKFKTARRLYVGNYLKGDQPIRDWTHPLYVSRDEYAKTFFPDMLSGPVYLFSFDVIESMTSLYRTKTPIAMEDGYIGILMESLKVKPRHNEHFWLLGMHGNKCNYLRMFFVQNVKPLDHLRLMASNKEARKSKECLKAKHIDFRSGKELDDENPS